MYTASENFYRTPDGTITTEPGEDHVLVASCGAVMSQAEARDRGLLPPLQSLQPEPVEPNASEVDAS